MDRDQTTDIRIRIDHVLPVPEAVLLGGTATAQVAHHPVAPPLLHEEAHHPVAALPPLTHILLGAAAARHGLGAVRQRLGEGHAVRAVTIIGGPGHARRPAATSLRDERTSETIALDRLGGMGTIRTRVRRGHAIGLHHPGRAMLRQLEAGECARQHGPVGTTSHVRASAGTPRRISPPPRDNRDYRRRSPSPRRDRTDPYTADTWRSRRSPSARPAYTSNEASGAQSAATSRRSSPRPTVHPSRAALVDDRPVREPASAPRSPFRERETSRAPRDNFRERERDRSPPRRREASPSRDRSPPRRRESSPPRGPRGDRDREFAPPTGPSSARRNGDGDLSRAPPTGPSSRSYPSPAISPPAGPASSTPTVPPTGPRGNPALSAPTRPRGGGRGGYPYDSPRDFSGPPRRGSWGAGPRGGGGFRGGFHEGPAAGPRGSVSGATSYSATFRGSSNSTATTYPRTMRFRDHLADLPKEIPGGQRAPEVYDKSKILRLEDEARKLREMIEKKEDAKRAKLREWDSIERDAETAQLRVDLAEQSLRNLNGETEVGGAAF
ncbi:hypothetical protein SVAN01_03905 [Stagonosporopsis vannaccii]|nr:hypothetical protein SVAN01_03905 [Stagonosporopsis vannaccii]